jgi:hypothetical protein
MTATPEEIEFAKNLADPLWRISNLYKIIIKGDDDEEGLVIQFKPNRAQKKFLSRLHQRNIILKARQLGFTTLIVIVWLDHALFNANSRCGIIAQDRDAAEVIFRDKVKFAYENLPEALRKAMPLMADNAKELLFAHNNSSIRVATSVRSGTIHRLHVSEFGKICAKFPDKAKEVVTGSLPAVPLNGITIIESTAEGAEGKFYEMTKKAIALHEQGKELTERDWRFHFFPWWQEDRYRMAPGGVVMTAKDHEYFDKIEATMSAVIDDDQRAWYVATRDADFVGSEDDMLQEYPSTPQEAFEVSSEGCYYTAQLSLVRKQSRILRIPIVNVPVNTFWDVGNSDGTAIWFHQQVGMEDRFIGYYEEHGEDLTHYAHYLQQTGFVFNKHFLPHDAGHVRLGQRNKSIEKQLNELGIHNTVVLPVTDSVNASIQLTRQEMATAFFDEERCKDGLQRLGGYKKKWNATAGRWSDEPLHDSNSEGADAFRQWAQAKAAGLVTLSGSIRRPEIQTYLPHDTGMGLG